MKIIVFLTCFISLIAAALSETVTYLNADSIVDFQPLRDRNVYENDLRIYCYRGSAKSVQHLFESVELQLEISEDDYTQYEGSTPMEVVEHYNDQKSLFSFSLFSQKRTRLGLSPFTQQCIGIETKLPYRVRLQQLRVDFWRLVTMIAALVLFMYAGQLSCNSIFYYSAGILLGICSSFLLIIWFASKLMPRRPFMYGMLVGGWTMAAYVIQLLWQNIQVIVITYRVYVFWYILISSVISFFVCYRLGPPKNKRSKNIVKWLLQIIALLSIYLSSHYEEGTYAIIIMAIIIKYFPISLIQKSHQWYSRHFPSKRRLLTSEEFREQGVQETAKALEELRVYVSSPKCKAWRVMSQLRDPMRFAAFVEGEPHLREDEILQFENLNDDDCDDDSNSSTIDEEDKEHGDLNSTRKLHNRNLKNSRLLTGTINDISEDDDVEYELSPRLVDYNNENKYTSHYHTKTLNRSQYK